MEPTAFFLLLYFYHTQKINLTFVLETNSTEQLTIDCFIYYYYYYYYYYY